MSSTYEAPFTLEINFERKIAKKVSIFHIGNKLSKANIDDAVDASFDVCKHWPTDQSERALHKRNFAK